MNIPLDPFNNASFKIYGVCKGVKLGPATAFVWQKNENDYLVTNWHVMSGRDVHTGQPLHKLGAIPDSITIRCLITSDEHENAKGIGEKTFSLVDENGCNLWLQHIQGQKIDVAVLPIEKTINQFMRQPLCINIGACNMVYGVGDDVFILGFPRGLTKQFTFPIWKRGSIASEPRVPLDDDMPAFLVDSATREGMSGSPVFARKSGAVFFENHSMRSDGQVYMRFLGIYSGRYGADDEFTAQLGLVWHSHLIDEIILKGRPGSFELS